MDRTFDYAQKILLAVELGDRPRALTGMPATYSVFQRLAIPEVVGAFDDAESLFVRLLGGRKFRSVLDEHMGYWEKRIPEGQQCYVHYAIGSDAVVQAAFDRLAAAPGAPFALLGTYHVEPQSSAYPFAFPEGPAPSHWNPGEARGATRESIYWFNFFPAQPHLFEKTFIVWALFALFQGRERGECNQLVASEGKERLRTHGVDEFVQVNLNRFTSLSGYFNSAFDAGKHSFTNDKDYRWYGMLLRKI